ncbi:O-antigen ligase family protein [Porifericola rhodea]|uniref:O-antigen ligase family protein n=1 Tax=Porifericola rhodea TaxID=930972 RepID=UPI0026662647|nr:O-antigen ligase family protein [Porifericola rhodea]WKN33475.1 O-antigen ligase family protein [Porifericola rhodea]
MDFKIPLKISFNKLFYNLVIAIFSVIFLQQVLVVNVGGSFKFYELFALIILFFFLLRGKNFYIYSKFSLLLFLFFIIATLPGTFKQYLMLEELQGFYNHFPEAKGSLRFNMMIAPVIVYFYYIICWLVINTIDGSRKVYDNKEKIIRLFVMVGTFTSIYALYGFFFVRLLGFPDLVPDMVDNRNHRPDYEFRTSGFSSEAGDLAFMLSWVMIYLLYYKNLFSKRKTITLQIINGVALLLTFSSNLLAFFLAVLISILVFDSLSKKIKVSVILISLGLSAFLVLLNSGYYELFRYVFYQKLVHLFEKPTQVSSTGSMRAYHIHMGLDLFKDNPLFGVGGGNSVFHLWKYDSLLSAQQDGVKSGLVKVIAETGIFGALCFYGFYIYYFIQILIRRHLTNNPLIKIGFIGGCTTFLMLASLYPVYSIFLWVNIALVLNELKFMKEKTNSLILENA